MTQEPALAELAARMFRLDRAGCEPHWPTGPEDDQHATLPSRCSDRLRQVLEEVKLDVLNTIMQVKRMGSNSCTISKHLPALDSHRDWNEAKILLLLMGLNRTQPSPVQKSYSLTQLHQAVSDAAGIDLQVLSAQFDRVLQGSFFRSMISDTSQVGPAWQALITAPAGVC